MRTEQTVTRKSPLTEKINTRVMIFDIQDYVRWQNGELIQNALPYLSVDDREFIKSGYTPEDWEELFKGCEDN